MAALTVGYLALLHAIHQNQIAPAFSYLQYTYRDPDPLHYAIAVALVVALALVLPRRIDRPSVFICWTLFIVAVAPSIVVPQYTEVLRPSDAMEVAFWVAGSFLPVAALGTRRAVRESLPTVLVSASTFWTAVVVVSIAVYAYVVADVGVSFELPSIEDVYGVRAQFAEVEDESSLLIRYAVPLLANVINPLLIARGLVGRRWLWLAGGLLGQVFIYSFTGYRSTILSPVVLLGTYLLFRRRPRPAAIAMLVGVIGLMATMWVLDVVTDTVDFTSLLVRRFLITPGLLTAAYVFVFADIPKAHFAHAFLRAFLDYPYSREPPQLIGELFFGDASTNANANLLADGYANVGFPGMVLECLVLMVVLWVIDDACRGLSTRIAAMVFVMPTLSLADSGLFTSLLTHGIGAGILVCLLIPRTGWEPEPGRPRTPTPRAVRNRRA